MLAPRMVEQLLGSDLAPPIGAIPRPITLVVVGLGMGLAPGALVHELIAARISAHTAGPIWTHLISPKTIPTIHTINVLPSNPPTHVKILLACLSSIITSLSFFISSL